MRFTLHLSFNCLIIVITIIYDEVVMVPRTWVVMVRGKGLGRGYYTDALKISLLGVVYNSLA